MFDAEEFDDLDEESEGIELEDIQVDTIGLVPVGANKRKYILLKGGVNAMEPQEVAKEILASEGFWDRIVQAFSGESGVEKASAAARVKMALRILGADSVSDAIKTLQAAKAGPEEEEEEEKARKPEEEEEEEKAKKPEEEEEKKAKPEDEEEEEKTGRHEEYEKKRGKKPDEEEYPEGYSRLAEKLQAAEQAARAAKMAADTALARLNAAEKAARLQTMLETAEKFAGLPEVEPEKFANDLLTLQDTAPAVYKAMLAILEGTRQAVGEIYSERGTVRTAGLHNPFLKRVEARAKELMAGSEKKYEEAYSDAYVEISEQDPNAAWAYLKTQK